MMMRIVPMLLVIASLLAVRAGGDPDNSCIQELPRPRLSDGARFGHAIAAWGEWLAVAAPYQDLSPANGPETVTGVVYIYRRTPNESSIEWQITQHIIAPDPDRSTRFGWSMSMANGMLAIGAPEDHTLGHKHGSAHVYRLSERGVWMQEQDVYPAPGGAGAFWGTSVSMSGEGRNLRLAIGAENADIDGIVDAGSVELWGLPIHPAGDVDPTKFISLASVVPPEKRGADRLGICVLLTDDLLLTGAYGDDTRATNAGAVYVYKVGESASGPVLTPLQTLRPQSENAALHFGYFFVANANRLAVGCYGDARWEVDRGAAMIYEWDTLGDEPQYRLFTTIRPKGEPRRGDFFGARLALDGDRLAVSAPQYNILGKQTHPGYVTLWSLPARITDQDIPEMLDDVTPDGVVVGAQVGMGMCLHDGVLFLGAPFQDIGGKRSGAVWTLPIRR